MSPTDDLESEPAGTHARRVDARERRERRLACAGVSFLVVLSFALRAPGLDFLLPHFMHRDGLVVVRMAELFRGTGVAPDEDRLYMAYPHLFPRLLALLPGLDAATAPEAVSVDRPLDLAAHIARANLAWIQARWASVLFSLLAIPATYRLARRFLDRGAALFAAALVATSLIHVHFSTLSQPHGIAGSFSVLAVLAALRARRRGRAVDFLIAGLFASLAVGLLHTGLAVVPALVVASLLREKHARRASILWIVPALALVALSVRWLYPWLFERPAVLDRTLPGELPIQEVGQFPDPFDGSGARKIVFSLWCYDPLLLALLPLGVVCLLARARRIRELVTSARGRDLAVVLAHALPYFGVLVAYHGTYERFLMPLIPAFACLASLGVARALAARPVFRAIAWSLLIVPLALAIHLARIRSAPDTLERAAEWIAAQVEPETRRILILPYVDLPLMHSDEAVAENEKHKWSSIWVRYLAEQPEQSRSRPAWSIYLMPGELAETRQRLANDPARYFDDTLADYVVLTADAEAFGSPAREALEQQDEKLLRISPLAVDDGSWQSLLFRFGGERFERPYWRLLRRARCMGPTVEIYRWRG